MVLNSVLHELKCNTITYRGSFYTDSVRCWNRIGHLFRNSPNLKSFKTKLLASYRSIPNSSFGIFDTLGVKRLFQLRVGLSPLLEHKRMTISLIPLQISAPPRGRRQKSVDITFPWVGTLEGQKSEIFTEICHKSDTSLNVDSLIFDLLI